MTAEPLTWTDEWHPGGVVRLVVAGPCRDGSAGNPDAIRLRLAVREVVEARQPSGLVIDLTGLGYRYGDWVGTLPLAALKALGPGRVCVVAAGPTGEALRPLWETSQFGRVCPLFADAAEAVRAVATGPG